MIILQTDSIGSRTINRLSAFCTHFAENIIENLYRDTGFTLCNSKINSVSLLCCEKSHTIGENI